MEMELIVERACGIDAHKEKLTATIMIGKGGGVKKETRTFSTMTNDLFRLKEWLKDEGVTHVAIESTGVYWKPIFNILEDSFEVILANARHIKHVPGRKTDVEDSQWLCKLLRNGLIKASFIPPKDIRELRDLTRFKKKLVQGITAEKNRIQKVLEDANIKLSSVASDIFGVSGTEMIKALLEGESSPEEMSKLARGKLKKKEDELQEALVGNLTENHKLLIELSLKHIQHINSLIAELDQQIDKKLGKYKEEYELLQTIPGVKEEAAASIIAEIGVDMDRFPSSGHLASWAGMCPGNNESGGKKKPPGQPMAINGLGVP